MFHLILLSAVSAHADPWAGTPIEVTSDCGADLSSYNQEVSGSSALRIVTVHQTRTDQVMGDVTVHSSLDQPNILVLTSYDPVRWVVTEEHPGSIQRIIATGYYDQQVVAPAGAVVELITGNSRWEGSGCYDWEDWNARYLVESVEAYVGQPITSFHGCYEGNEFSLQESTEPLVLDEPDCAESVEPDGAPNLSILADRCPAVMAESQACLSIRYDGEVVLFGLDSGALCDVTRAQLPAANDNSSITWMGDYVYSCTGNDYQLARTSLVDGSTETAFQYCQGVSSWDGGLLTPLTWQNSDWLHVVEYCPTFRDAQCGRCQIQPYDIRGSRITAYGDTLISAWHSTSEVELQLLPTGEDLGWLTLEDFDTWIMGMSVLDDSPVGATAPSGSPILALIENHQAIRTFDLATGAALRSIPIEDDIWGGLYCFNAGIEPPATDTGEAPIDTNDTTVTADGNEPPVDAEPSELSPSRAWTCGACPGRAGWLGLALAGLALLARRRHSW